MLRKLRPRSAYDVIALLGLFVALGGTTYAAATIGSSNIKNNAVLSRHIKDGQVTNPDLSANSVGTGKVIDGSLLASDFRPGQLSSAASHYVTFDLGPGTGNTGDTKPIYEKGPFTLSASCFREVGGVIGMTVDLEATDKFSATTSTDTQGAGGFGRAASTHTPSDGPLTIAKTDLHNSFYWYGGAPISAIDATTSLDGVLSYGVLGYHSCEVSFFGG